MKRIEEAGERGAMSYELHRRCAVAPVDVRKVSCAAGYASSCHLVRDVGVEGLPDHFAIESDVDTVRIQLVWFQDVDATGRVVRG